MKSAKRKIAFARSYTRAASTPAKRRSTNHAESPSRHLSVSLQVEGVVALPGLSATSSCLVESVTLAQTTRLLASSGETPGLAVLVDGGNNPVDASITTDSLVLRVDEDDFVVLVGRVLVDPVGVQDTQVCASAANTLFGRRLQGSLVLELVDTLVGWLSFRETSISAKLSQHRTPPPPNWALTVSGTLGRRALATSTADTDTVDDISLLGLVTQTASLVRTGWAGSSVNDIQLAKLYYALSAKFNECIAGSIRRCPH